MTVITLKLRMVQVVMGDGIRISKEPVGLHFFRDEFMSGMPRGVHQLVVENIGEQNNWLHRDKQDQQSEETELKDSLERLKGKNRPRCRRDGFVMPGVEQTKQGPGMHQPVRQVKVSVVEKHREEETEWHPPPGIFLWIYINRGVSILHNLIEEQAIKRK